MEKVQMISLDDGSVHRSKQMAERHLMNELSSGVCLELFELLSNRNTLQIKGHFIDNANDIIYVMKKVRELKEVINTDI